MNNTQQLQAELRQVVADGFLPDEAGMRLVRRDSTPPCAEYDATARQIGGASENGKQSTLTSLLGLAPSASR